jgi:hypothetical protein
MKVLSLSAIMILTLISVGWGQTKRPRTLDELAQIANKSYSKERRPKAK